MKTSNTYIEERITSLCFTSQHIIFNKKHKSCPILLIMHFFVGDSRKKTQVLCGRDKDHVLDVCEHKLPVMELYADHHPNKENEKLRIELSGGFVEIKVVFLE